MRLKNLFLVLVVSTWTFADAGASSAFTLALNKDKEVCDQSEVGNMPRFRSQDSVPICEAMVASTLAQFQFCKRTGVADCSAVPEDKETSPLSMLAWIHTNKGMGVHEVGNNENLDFLKFRGY